MSSKKVPVTLTYASPGAQPPIFLAGSFSEPAWHPQEMDFKTDEDGEHKFHKEVLVEQGGQFQYKFRIGNGDWWALNEQAPTSTDDLGNRNNLLAVPVAVESHERLAATDGERLKSESTTQTSIPEVVVEKVDTEPRYGDDFGSKATTGQKDAHEMRAQDAEPDHVVVRSETSTPLYAATAAEVADSAAIIDRESSPALMSDEEAGRTGQRRMSGTPIPQVAITAAEVTDSAALIDRLDMEMPPFLYPLEMPQATAFHEQAPLFAHECLSPQDGDETERPKGGSIDDSIMSPVPDEAMVDPYDPLIEEFPQDRMSILEHVRSTESRLSEDETHFDTVPPSPLVDVRSFSPNFGSPSSSRIDAQPSPVLDVIAEEGNEPDDPFVQLPSPSRSLVETKELKVGTEEDKDGYLKPTLIVHSSKEVTEEVEKSDVEPTMLKASEREIQHTEEPKAMEELIEPKELKDEEEPIEIVKSMAAPASAEEPEAESELTEQAQETKDFNEMKEPKESRGNPEEHKEDEHQILNEERTAQPEELKEIEQAQTMPVLENTEELREEISTVKDPEESDKLEEIIQPTETNHQKESVKKSEELKEIENPSQDLEKVEKSEIVPLIKGAHEPPSIQESDKSTEPTEPIEPEEPQQGKELEGVSASVLIDHDLTSGQLTTIEPLLIGVTTETHHMEHSGAPKDIDSNHPASDLVVPPLETNPDERRLSVAKPPGTEDIAVDHGQRIATSEILSKINVNEHTAAIVAGESAHAIVSQKEASPIIDVKETPSATADKTLTIVLDDAPTVMADEADTRVTDPPPETPHYKAPSLTVDREVSKVVDDKAPAVALDKEVQEIIPTEEASNVTADKSSNIITGLTADIAAPTLAVGILAAEEAPAVVAKQKLPALISAKTATEDAPAVPVDGEVSAVHRGKGGPKFTAEEVPAVVAKEEIPALASAKTAAEEVAAVPIERGIPIVTVDNSSPPFLVQSAALDIQEQNKSDEPHTSGMNGAKSASFEDPVANSNKQTELRMRNVSTTERALTPASTHSIIKSKDSGNFFQALWRTVFVGWIGGLITWLFGGGRGP